MRASELVGKPVQGIDGTHRGRVSDVRLVQDGPLIGTWGAAFRVAGLVVTPRRAGSMLGYERSTLRGPWLVKKVVTWLHRDAVFVPWSEVREVGEEVVTVGDSRRLETTEEGT